MSRTITTVSNYELSHTLNAPRVISLENENRAIGHIKYGLSLLYFAGVAVAVTTLLI